YPVASISAWMEEHESSSYQNFNIGENFNLLKSFGAGIQEPWSISLFLGQLGTYWDLDDDDELFIAATGASGLVLTGGGALIRGIDSLMNEQLGIPVRVADDPLTTVVRGTAICLEHLSQWRDSLDAGDADI
ncbi:MAG: rod shape-determining protein, partial [Planctomycetes bacterium]|nr:rod shape-determining protein [Planctomycetota bacterium]